MCAFDLPTREFRDRVLQRCYDEGLVILGCGQRSIRFRSPLTITADEIDEGLGLLTHSLHAIEKEYNPYGNTGLRDALTGG